MPGGRTLSAARTSATPTASTTTPPARPPSSTTHVRSSSARTPSQEAGGTAGRGPWFMHTMCKAHGARVQVRMPPERCASAPGAQAAWCCKGSGVVQLANQQRGTLSPLRVVRKHIQGPGLQRWCSLKGSSQHGTQLHFHLLPSGDAAIVRTPLLLRPDNPLHPPPAGAVPQVSRGSHHLCVGAGK